MCKLFEESALTDFLEPDIFSKSSKHFIIELAQGNSYFVKLHFRNREFYAFSL